MWSKQCEGCSVSPGQAKGRGWRCCWAEPEDHDVPSKLCSACTATRRVARPQWWGPAVQGKVTFLAWAACLLGFSLLLGVPEGGIDFHWASLNHLHFCVPVSLNCGAPPFLIVISTEDDLHLCTRCPSLYMSNSTKSLWWKTRQGTNLQIKKEMIKDWWQNVTLWAQIWIVRLWL